MRWIADKTRVPRLTGDGMIVTADIAGLADRVTLHIGHDKHNSQQLGHCTCNCCTPASDTCASAAVSEVSSMQVGMGAAAGIVLCVSQDSTTAPVML